MPPQVGAWPGWPRCPSYFLRAAAMARRWGGGGRPEHASQPGVGRIPRHHGHRADDSRAAITARAPGSSAGSGRRLRADFPKACAQLTPACDGGCRNSREDEQMADGRRSWHGIAVLVMTALAAVACTAAPPPAHHAAKPAHPQAASTAQKLAAAENIRAQNALAGDPGWQITHPGHLYQLEGSPTRPTCRPGLVPAVRVDHGAELPGPRVPDGLVRRRPGPPGMDLGGDTGPLPGGGEDRPAGVDGGRALGTEPDRADDGWPPGSYLLRLDASTGVQSYVPIVIRSPSAAGRVVLVSAVTSYQAYNGWGRTACTAAEWQLRRPRPPGHL